MPPQITNSVAALKEKKQWLLTEVNRAAQEFVDKNADPLTALTDPDVKAMIEKLQILKDKLTIFLDAVEYYMNSSGTDVVFALENMLKHLKVLQAAMQDLRPTKNEKSSVIPIRKEIDVFVKKLIEPQGADPSFIKQLIDIVPQDLINLTLNAVGLFGVTISDLFTRAINLKTATNALQLMADLGIRDAMLESTEDRLKPLEDLFTSDLNALKILPSQTLPAEPVKKIYTLKIVEDARIELVEGINKQLKELVKNHDNVLDFAVDPKVVDKIQKLNDLKENVELFLDATENYLTQWSFNPSIPQLTELMKHLAALQKSMEALKPKDPLTESELLIQKRIDIIVTSLLKSDSAIFKLIDKLSESKILSMALAGIKKVDTANLKNTATAAVFVEPITYYVPGVGELNPLVNYLGNTSLPEYITGPSQSAKEILTAYFTSVLNNLQQKPSENMNAVKTQPQAPAKQMSEIRLSDLTHELGQQLKGEHTAEYHILKQYVLKLTELLASAPENHKAEVAIITQETVAFILTYTHLEIPGVTKPPPQDIAVATMRYKNNIAAALTKISAPDPTIDAPALKHKVLAVIGALIGFVRFAFSGKAIEHSRKYAESAGGTAAAHWWRHVGSPSSTATHGITEATQAVHKKINPGKPNN